MTPGGFSLYTTKPQNTPLFKSPAWGTRKKKTIPVRSASSILLGLDRGFLNNSSDSLFVVLLCLRSCGTAQVTSQTQPDLRACVHSELPKSPVMTTAALRPVNWSSRVCCQLVTPPLWSTHRSLVVSLTILWFLLLRLNSRSIRIGVCLPLCASVSVGVPQNHPHSHTRQHEQITRSLARWRS